MNGLRVPALRASSGAVVDSSTSSRTWLLSPGPSGLRFHRSRIVAGKALQKLNQILLLSLSKVDGLQFPIAVGGGIPTPVVKANYFRERGGAAVVKVGCGQFYVAQ